MPGDLTELFTWTELDPIEGEGTVACVVPFLVKIGISAPVPLVTRSRAIAYGPFADVAQLHHTKTGHRVRLVRWSVRETLQDLTVNN